MMEYVLIIILSVANGHQSIFSQDFYSKKACEKARTEIVAALPETEVSKAFCVEKGK
jgi:hypothetical protein